MRTTERFVADTDPQNILDCRLMVCSDTISTYFIFTNHISARGITLMRQKRLDELREAMTLEHDKTHWGRGLITIYRMWLMMEMRAALGCYQMC